MVNQDEEQPAGHQRYLRCYLKLLVVILVFTAVLKLGGSFSTKPYLEARDPLLFFATQRSVLVMAALAEFACAAFLVFRPLPQGLLASSWLILLFCLYRMGTYMLGAGANVCPCLGFWIPLKPEIVNRITIGLLFFMVLGNVCGLAIMYKDRITAKLKPLPQTQ